MIKIQIGLILRLGSLVRP